MLEKIAAIFSIGWKKWQKQILAVFLTAVVVIAGLFFAPTPGALAADPTAPTTSEQSTEQGSTAESPTAAESTPSEPPSEDTNCNDQLGALGWLVCPGTGTIAKAIDYIYGQIVNFIKINPITTDQSSATFIIWEYARSITNIVFIIFIVIIVISQVTGFGISNYGLKRALPRIIVAAVLVNLSFIICTLAVDISNILGFSVHNLFTSVAEGLSSSGMDLSGIPTISWSDFTSGILAGVPLADAASVAGMAFTGGFGGLILLLAPVVLGAVVAVIAALLTLAARQALITLLVMIAPLAFVAYLLPNTESLFKKWRDLLVKLLVFFPMFSLLFGASQLAGWAIMLSSNGDPLVFILGMAVQIFPLIFAPTLLKMSGTILGKVNELARRPFAPAQNALAKYASERRAYHTSMHRRYGKSASASLARAVYHRRSYLDARKETADKDMITEAVRRTSNRRLGLRPDGTGPVKPNKDMRREMEHRELILRSANSENELNEKMGALPSYLKANKIKTNKGIASRLKHLTDLQAENYSRSMDIQRAIAADDKSDKRFYFDQVRKAGQMDKSSAEYQNRIMHSAGSDALDDDKLIRDNAIMLAEADAYEMYEKERKAIRDKTDVFLGSQVTDVVFKYHQKFVQEKNTDGAIVTNAILDKRGDHDKIRDTILKAMRDPNYFALTEDYTNRMALSFLSMSKSDPLLGRLGKHLNKQTWAFTDSTNKLLDAQIRNRVNSSGEYVDEEGDIIYIRPQGVTDLEYVAGIMSDGKKLKRDGLTRLISGTSLKDIDRNAISNVLESIDYAEQEFKNRTSTTGAALSDLYPDLDFEEIKKATLENMMPQIISALPTFESGGEQIRSVLKIFTSGAKFNEDKKEWYFNNKENPSHKVSRLSQEMTEFYLKSLTPDRLIDLKTDMFQTVQFVLKNKYGSEQAAKEQFRKIQNENGNLNIVSSSPLMLEHMKKGVREWLGINTQD